MKQNRPTFNQAGNPHIWLDPVLAQDICRKIAAAFIQADPGHRAQYEANLKNYLTALDELNREIEAHAQIGVSGILSPSIRRSPISPGGTISMRSGPLKPRPAGNRRPAISRTW